MIALVDYRAGNLTSVRLAFQALGAEVRVTDDPAEVGSAERVVFPGVGAAPASMENLRRLRLVEPLKESIRRGAPFLGICMGMQVLFERSEEGDDTECLGVLAGEVRRFRSDEPGCKIPQMGWNAVRLRRAHPLFDGIEDGSEFYFVHSYYPVPRDPEAVVGETEYAGVTFASVVARGNVVAAQFHPERSGRIGLRMLDNFLRWDAPC